MEDHIKSLAALFAEFPGIGERQSRRFVYYLLSRNPAYLASLAKLITELPRHTTRCTECYRFFERTDDSAVCTTCSDPKRTKDQLMIVEKDADLTAIERSKTYSGKYFVFGGLVPVVEKDTPKYIRLNELQARIKKGGITEVILAFSLHPQGEHTDTYIREHLRTLADEQKFRLVSLGRGLSTGTELEYSDADTLESALKNRQ